MSYLYVEESRNVVDGGGGAMCEKGILTVARSLYSGRGFDKIIVLFPLREKK
jgi:hypothetical protein